MHCSVYQPVCGSAHQSLALIFPGGALSLSLPPVSISQHASPRVLPPLLSCVQIAVISLSRFLATTGSGLLQCKRWQSSIGASGRLPPPPLLPRRRIPLSMGISGKLRARLHGFQLTNRLAASQRLPPSPS